MRVVGLLALAVALAACPKPAAPAAPPASQPTATATAAEAVAYLEPLTEKVCACADQACKDALLADPELKRFDHIGYESDAEIARVDAVVARLKGCSAPPAPKAAEAIAFLEPLVAKVCGCPDKACVKAALAEADPLIQKYGDVAYETDEELAKIDELSGKLARCVAVKTKTGAP